MAQATSSMINTQNKLLQAQTDMMGVLVEIRDGIVNNKGGTKTTRMPAQPCLRPASMLLIIVLLTQLIVHETRACHIRPCASKSLNATKRAATDPHAPCMMTWIACYMGTVNTLTWAL